MPYKTLAELRDAYASGKLTAPLMLDNDNTSVWVDDGTLAGVEAFEMDPHDVMHQALDLLGIPWDHV